MTPPWAYAIASARGTARTVLVGGLGLAVVSGYAVVATAAFIQWVVVVGAAEWIAERRRRAS